VISNGIVLMKKGVASGGGIHYALKVLCLIEQTPGTALAAPFSGYFPPLRPVK